MHSLISLKPSIKLKGDKTLPGDGDNFHSFMGPWKQFSESWIVCVDGGGFCKKIRLVHALVQACLCNAIYIVMSVRKA